MGLNLFAGYLMADPMHPFLFTLGYEGVTIEACSRLRRVDHVGQQPLVGKAVNFLAKHY